jgi:hypothetical protein
MKRTRDEFSGTPHITEKIEIDGSGVHTTTIHTTTSEYEGGSTVVMTRTISLEHTRLFFYAQNDGGRITLPLKYQENVQEAFKVADFLRDAGVVARAREGDKQEINTFDLKTLLSLIIDNHIGQAKTVQECAQVFADIANKDLWQLPHYIEEG